MSMSRIRELVVHACEQGLYEDWVEAQLKKENVTYTRDEIDSEFAALDPE